MAYPKMGEITDKFVGQPYDLNSVLSPAKVWEKLDAQSEEVRVFTNSLIDLLNSTGEDNWLYTAIVNAILGQITDGSLTDVKLSDEAGQIKERLTSFVATYDAFVATKDQAGGIPSLGLDTKLIPTQLPLVSVTGSFSDTTTVIEVGATYTKTIPLGITGKTGSCMLYAYSSMGSMVLFNTVQASSLAMLNTPGSSAAYFSMDGLLGYATASAYDLRLEHCYIDGTDLKFIFKNIHTSPLTLCIAKCTWEVQV